MVRRPVDLLAVLAILITVTVCYELMEHFYTVFRSDGLAMKCPREYERRIAGAI